MIFWEKKVYNPQKTLKINIIIWWVNWKRIEKATLYIPWNILNLNSFLIHLFYIKKYFSEHAKFILNFKQSLLIYLLLGLGLNSIQHLYLSFRFFLNNSFKVRNFFYNFINFQCNHLLLNYSIKTFAGKIQIFYF